jgi:hypothetical protein
LIEVEEYPIRKRVDHIVAGIAIEHVEEVRIVCNAALQDVDVQRPRAAAGAIANGVEIVAWNRQPIVDAAVDLDVTVGHGVIQRLDRNSLNRAWRQD